MAESSRTFNFDDFDQQIAEALAENDRQMRPLRPGEIGAVAIKPSFEIDPDDLPPAA